VTGRVSCIKTYLKFVPTYDDEKRFRDTLYNVYNIKYDEYIKNFKNAPLLPSSCKLTSHGSDYIRKSQYELLDYQAGNRASLAFVIAICFIYLINNFF
jgi:hypothetical protein